MDGWILWWEFVIWDGELRGESWRGDGVVMIASWSVGALGWEWGGSVATELSRI